MLERDWETKMRVKKAPNHPQIHNFKGNEGTCGPTPGPLSKTGFVKDQREALGRIQVKRSLWREWWPCCGHPPLGERREDASPQPIARGRVKMKLGDTEDRCLIHSKKEEVDCGQGSNCPQEVVRAREELTKVFEGRSRGGLPWGWEVILLARVDGRTQLVVFSWDQMWTKGESQCIGFSGLP